MAEELRVVEHQFKQCDVNGDGKITREEFGALFRTLNPLKWNDTEVDKLFQAADTDCSGYLNVQEFLIWVFGGELPSKNAKKGKLKGKAKKRSASVSSSSSSGSSDWECSSVSTGEEEDFRRELRKAAAPKAAAKVKKGMVPHAQMYELATMVDGRQGGRMQLEELADLFMRCRRAGLTADVGALVPQRIDHVDTTGRDPEDVYPLELAHIFAALKQKPGSTPDELMEVIYETKHDCRKEEYLDGHMEKYGLNGKATVSYHMFKRIVAVLETAMLIDQETILTQMLWSRFCIFEMTIPLLEEVMKKLFLRVPQEKVPLIESPIKGNDFMRMCYVQGVTDSTHERGIPRSHLNLFWEKIGRTMPQLIKLRQKKRADFRLPKLKVPENNKEWMRPEIAGQAVAIFGQVRVSILFQELYKAMPPDVYNGPLHMVVTFLQNSDVPQDQSPPE